MSIVGGCLKQFFKEYIGGIKLEKWQVIGLLCLVFVISGIFGWIYEFFFYYFNGGMEKFYWRGGNFLPWINIYSIGAIMILILSYRFRRKPLLVFLIAFISTGILEYFSGLVIYEWFGLRFWNYNTEILNFGNISGYVCLRSVSFFGLSALLLMYLIVPFCIYLSLHIDKRKFLIISVSLFSIFLFDELYNLVFSRLLGMPRARDVYQSIGFNFMNYRG